MRGRLNYSGIIVAGIGFFLTRFTVTIAIDDPVRFYAAGVLPLLLGLGVAAFGVALMVADVEASLVRTTALWCVIGAGTMAVLVLLTLIGSTGGTLPRPAALRSQLYLSNFLIGGSLGGTLTGLYAARTQRQRRELREQTNRLEVLNRLLRHEVLNAVTVIQGYAAWAGEHDTDDAEIIEQHSTDIATTIEEVRYLTRTTSQDAGGESVDVSDCLDRSIETVSDRHPAATISVGDRPGSVQVQATERVEQVFENLLDNAIVHATSDEPTVCVSVDETATHVSISVADEGPGLPDPQQVLLESGEITDFDDPRDGYDLNIVRLLVESFGGTIDTEVTDTGSTITVTLARPTGTEIGFEPSRSGITGIRLDVPHLAVTLGAAILAGVAYGIVSEQLGGSVAAIGVFYGISDPVIGWVTHEFHSAVFAFIYAGLVSVAPTAYRDHLPAFVAIGIVWALVLWAAAAGVIAPLWLRLLGFQVPIPNLTGVLLAAHVVWGITLGLFTGLGYRYVSPRLRRLGRTFE
ncbi:sensor histidine kinase [Natronomonas marina]|uniref:sensor histidine kinase n=1 Tax=Natronomonas marina TaxID=2961939 RepID=UPI0020C96649|nr:HAMP domain-containing sensor histidine kinase [Natronomonas marina]